MFASPVETSIALPDTSAGRSSESVVVKTSPVVNSNVDVVVVNSNVDGADVHTLYSCMQWRLITQF